MKKMNERVYKVTDDTYDVYWVDDPSTIYDSFGKVVEVVQYELMDPVDITDQLNGKYLGQ